MKKTNDALVHKALRLLKMLPVLLCVFLLGSSNLAAQDYLPLDQAIEVVKTALSNLEDAAIEVNSTMDMDSDYMKNSMSKGTYEYFLKEAKDLGVEGAYEKVETHLRHSAHNSVDRTELANDTLQDLLELITE